MANFSSIKFNDVDYSLKDASARDNISQLQGTVNGLDTRMTELEQEVGGVSDIIEKGSGDNSTIVGSTSKNTDPDYENIASGSYSYAEGGRRPDETETHEPKTYPQLQATGDFSHAEGASTKASGKYSHAQNKQCTASGEASTAIGASTSASGKNSFSAGELSVASGRTSIAMGGLSEATGDYAVAIGSGVNNQKNIASGPNSFALGFNNTASGEKAYAQGNSSVASGQFAFALGNTNTASGQSATAIGAGNIAGSINSVAIGHNARANATSGKSGGVAIGENVEVTAPYGVALGAGLIPRQDANGNNVADTSVGRVVLGRYNEAPAQTDIITFGIGSASARKTGLILKTTGDLVGCGTTPATDNSFIFKKYAEDNFAPKAANGYIEKQSGNYKVYVNNGSGALDVLDYAKDSAKVNSVAVRNANGQLWCATPTETNHAATKGYVDNIAPIIVEIGGFGNINGATSTDLWNAFVAAETSHRPVYLVAPNLTYSDDPHEGSVDTNGIGSQMLPFVKQAPLYVNRYYFTVTYFPASAKAQTASLYITSNGKITAITA